MNRSCVWLCTLTAATAATISEVRAFTLHGSGASGLAHFVAGPEFHVPGGGAPVLVKPPAPPSGHYNFSGNSFNLSVTRNGRAPPPGPPPPRVAPNSVPERPGFIQRLFNWW
jgi:hypothetical protein